MEMLVRFPVQSALKLRNRALRRMTEFVARRIVPEKSLQE